MCCVGANSVGANSVGCWDRESQDMSKRMLKGEDIELLVADMDLLEKMIQKARRDLLDAMEHVRFSTGWRLMGNLYKAEENVCRIRGAIEELAPRSLLPASDAAPDLVGEWLRKGVDSPHRHEGERAGD